MPSKSNLIFSIVTPSYNQDKFIGKTIESILSQKGDFYIDYIIMDGNSVDSSVEIIKKFEKKIKKTAKETVINGKTYYKNSSINCAGISFYWESKKDRGQAHAINKGFERATGDIMTWINSDDYYHSSKSLEIVRQFFERNPAYKIFFGGVAARDGDYKLKWKLFPKDASLENLLYSQCLAQPAVFWSSEVYNKVGTLEESYRYVFDLEYWLRVRLAGFEFKKIFKHLATQVYHDESKSCEGDTICESFRDEQVQCRRKYKKLLLMKNPAKFIMIYYRNSLLPRAKNKLRIITNKIKFLENFRFDKIMDLLNRVVDSIEFRPGLLLPIKRIVYLETKNECMINTRNCPPILFIAFNRPKLAERVFERIRQAQPTELYIAADGPRLQNDQDKKTCNQTRKIITKVDWKCEVHTLFHDRNLGCKIAPSVAINWFFSHVDEGIILEDDCLPDPTFFKYCNELLKFYRFDSRVMMISGDNFQPQKRGDGSYYFSKVPRTWGWATWKRAWNLFDINLNSYEAFKERNRIYDVFDDAAWQNFWISNLDKVFEENLDTWDYIWFYTVFVNHGLVIKPNVNLISNIGFTEKATHTRETKKRNEQIIANRPTRPLKEIIHPSFMLPDRFADNYSLSNTYYMKKDEMLNLDKVQPRANKSSKPARKKSTQDLVIELEHMKFDDAGRKNYISNIKKISKFINPKEKDLHFNFRSYSQEGEDLILETIFKKKNVKPGFYVDVGAYHPSQYSNTKLFYDRGWKGINIEPFSGYFIKFQQERPRDINLKIGIADSEDIGILTVFDQPAYNTFDQKHARHIADVRKAAVIVDEEEVQLRPLRKVLDNNLREGTEITFLNIDTENYEVKVLISNDWDKYRPRFVLVEAFDTDQSRSPCSKVIKIMKKNNYAIIAQTFRTLIFENQNYVES